jgi:hypothetical protein
MELNGVVWKVEERRDGASFRWGTIDRDFVAVWEGLLTLRAGPDGRPIAVEEASGASPSVIEKACNGIARAFLRSIVGKVSLHASAVTDGRQAILFLGSSGAGKSTMAEHLCRSHGFHLLADDVTALDFESGAWVIPPTESNVWLLREDDPSAESKHPVATPKAVTAARLDRIIVLDFDDSTREALFAPLRGAAAAAVISQAAIRFHATTRSMKDELEVTARLLAQASVFRFARPRASSASLAADVVARTMGTPKDARNESAP